MIIWMSRRPDCLIELSSLNYSDDGTLSLLRFIEDGQILDCLFPSRIPFERILIAA